MNDLLPLLIPIALIDSLSITPLGLVPLIGILAGPKRYLTALGLLSGLYFSYLIMALAFLFGLSAVLNKVNAWLSYRWHNPDPADFGVEIALGLVLLILGWPIASRRKEKSSRKSLATRTTPGSAFSFGFILTVVGFPGAVPYFAAADRIAQANLTQMGMVTAVVFYVTIFILPLALLVIMHRLWGSRLDGFLKACQDFFETTGTTLLRVAMILLGAAMVADGVAYFFFGGPLVPIGFPTSS